MTAPGGVLAHARIIVLEAGISAGTNAGADVRAVKGRAVGLGRRHVDDPGLRHLGLIVGSAADNCGGSRSTRWPVRGVPGQRAQLSGCRVLTVGGTAAQRILGPGELAAEVGGVVEAADQPGGEHAGVPVGGVAGFDHDGK